MVVLIVAGIHVPVTGGLLEEVEGSCGGTEFRHNVPPLTGKVVVRVASTVILIDTVLAF